MLIHRCAASIKSLSLPRHLPIYISAHAWSIIPFRVVDQLFANTNVKRSHWPLHKNLGAERPLAVVQPLRGMGS